MHNKKLYFALFVGIVVGMASIFAFGESDSVQKPRAVKSFPKLQNTRVVEVQSGAVVVTTDPDTIQKINTITPYQYLNLMVGNAEQYRLTYSWTDLDAPTPQTVVFYRDGERYASVCKEKDMNGNWVSVREVEMDGHVHYIMDDSRTVKTYEAPAEDFFIYNMMDVTMGEVVSKTKKEIYTVYRHQIPFEQDETMFLTYDFYMHGDVLKKVVYTFNNTYTKTYEIKELFQDTIDESVFTYPAGYQESWYNEPYTGEHMSPWWEIGNDI